MSYYADLFERNLYRSDIVFTAFITEQRDAKLVPETGSKFLHKLVSSCEAIKIKMYEHRFASCVYLYRNMIFTGHRLSI